MGLSSVLSKQDLKDIRKDLKKEFAKQPVLQAMKKGISQLGLSQAKHKAAPQPAGQAPGLAGKRALPKNGTLLVDDGKGHKMEVKFAQQPIPEKKIKGDVDKAKRTLASLIPANKNGEWKKLDKFNITAVRDFLKSCNLKPKDKAQFVQAYLTSHFNHPGNDIDWNGATLQDGIRAMPTDKQGRKFLDCEGFLKVSQTLLGADKVKAYAVDCNNSGSRNHQVGVYREGQRTYVISNNAFKEVPTAKKLSDEKAIKQVHRQYKDIIADRSGVMNFGTESYKVGQMIAPGKNQPRDITITRIRDGQNMEGYRTVNGGAGGNFYVRIHVDPATGGTRWLMAPKAGDEIVDTKQNRRIMITGSRGANQYTGEIRQGGRKHNVLVTVNRDGTWAYNPIR